MSTERSEEAQAFLDFPKNIKDHELAVIKDDGLYRHLRMAKPGTLNQSFEVITWPNYLAFTGDMGCYVFSRIADMFAFFRQGGDRAVEPGHPIVNLQYWGEKLTAADTQHGFRKWSPRVFAERITELARDFAEEQGLDALDIEAFNEEVKQEVIGSADNGPQAAYDAARDFEWQDTKVFPDFRESNCEEYSYHYVWCCQAIVEAIRLYDGRRVAVCVSCGKSHRDEVTKTLAQVVILMREADNGYHSHRDIAVLRLAQAEDSWPEYSERLRALRLRIQGGKQVSDKDIMFCCEAP